MKCTLFLFLVLYQADNQNAKTDPPVFLQAKPFVCLDGTDVVEQLLSMATEKLLKLIDDYVSNGSEYVLGHFLWLKIVFFMISRV